MSPMARISQVRAQSNAAGDDVRAMSPIEDRPQSDQAAARWEHFAHGSDVGVRGFGPTMAEAFEQAALALTAVVADLSTIQARQSVDVRCDAEDSELLLVNWLNAVIYEMAVRRMLFNEFHVVVDGNSLRGTLVGERVDPGRHEVAVEAKGATVTALRVDRSPNGEWRAQSVIDV